MKPLRHSLIALAITALIASPAWAKKGTAAPTDGSTAAKTTPAGADASKAELAASLALANIKLGRVALNEDATLADVKDTVTGIYDRQETATKSALDQLRSAGADPKARAAAVAAINAADDEASAYFTKNPPVNDRIKRRVTIINAEVGQIGSSPTTYAATLQKVGVSGDALAKATAVAKDAAAKSGGKATGDGLEACLDGRTQVHQMMSTRQLKLLDAQFAAK